MERTRKHIDEAETADTLYSLACAWLNPADGNWRLDGQVRDALESKPENVSRSFLSRAYTQLLTMGGEANVWVLPVESVYRVWTEDPGCKVPFAHGTGYLEGDSTLYMRALLEQLGVSKEQLGGLQPDHLAVLLNVAGALFERDPAKGRAFAREHFSWLEEFKGRCESRWQGIPGSEWYLRLIELTRTAVRQAIEPQTLQDEGRMRIPLSA